MSKIIEFAIIMAIVFIVACISGTCIYWLWDTTIPRIFPGLVQNGMIVHSIAWFDCVKLSWICTLLFQGLGNSKK